MHPFRNDPFEVLAEAFQELYPNHHYHCQWVDDLNVTTSRWGEFKARFYQFFGRALNRWGITIFPEDGGTPLIEIDATLPMCHAIEVFAHELAHVVVGPEEEHGEEWERVFDQIHQKYHELSRLKFENPEEE